MKILIVAVITLLLGCSQFNQPPTFTRYNEFRATGKLDLFEEYKLKRREHLNLATIINGVDSIELRFWIFNGESFGGTDLFIVKYDSAWKAFHYFLDMIVEPDKHVRTFSDSTFLVKSISPLSGWKKFVDSLTEFRLDTIPTQNSIPGFVMAQILDAPAYEVEIATRSYYRRLNYHYPEMYNFKQSKIFGELVQMMIRQLGNDSEWFGWSGHYE